MSRKLLTLLLACAAGAGLAESALRIAGLDTASYHAIGGFCRYDADLGWTLRPGLRRVFRGPDFTTTVAISPQGLRDRVYPYRAEDGRRRIVVLGDSVVWCWGVEMEDCFTKRLEAALNGTDVISVGVPGYGTAQELLLYEREIHRFSPDLVLLVFVGNDPIDNLDAGRRPRFELRDGELVLTNHPVPRRKSRVKEWLMAHSRLWAQLNYAVQAGQAALASPPSPDGGPRFRQEGPAEGAEALAVAGDLVERLRASVESHGARFAVLALFPTAAALAELERFSSERHVALLDPGPALADAEARGERVRFPRDPHLAPPGQRILARELHAFLETEGLLGP